MIVIAIVTAALLHAKCPTVGTQIDRGGTAQGYLPANACPLVVSCGNDKYLSISLPHAKALLAPETTLNIKPGDADRLCTQNGF